jgi:tetratricopeptide (TPR) repeat protein
MPNAARAPKIIEMPLKRHADQPESFVPASLGAESPAAIAARKLEALAHFHMATEEYEEALDAFKRLLKLVPVRSDLLVQTVACMERLERWEEGAALLAPEVEAHPDWTDAALALGICRLHLNQGEEAYAVFQAVEARSPGNTMAKEGIRAAMALIGTPAPAPKPENWELDLHELCAAREWEKVLEAAMRFQEDGEPAAHFYSAYACEQLGRVAEARLAYEACLEANPSHREARHNLACLLIRVQQYRPASEHLEYLTSIDSSNWAAWWNYMLSSERAGRFEKAICAAQRLIQMEGYSPELRFRLAYNCLEAGRYEEAARQFEQCLEDNDNWTEAKVNLGLALDRMGKADRAQAIFGAVLREQPLNVEAAQALMESHLNNGNWEEAMTIYGGLEARGAAPASLSYSLAKIFENRGEDHLARQYLERALRSEPTFTDALICLGEILGRQGDSARQKQCNELALRLNPAVAAAYFASGEGEGAADVPPRGTVHHVE